MGDGAESLVFLVTRPHPEGIQDPIKSFLVRAKDVSVTQEVPRDLGALCQELGAETKYMFLTVSHTPTFSS